MINYKPGEIVLIDFPPATLEKALVARTLGKLQASDHQTVAVTLRQLFAAW